MKGFVAGSSPLAPVPSNESLETARARRIHRVSAWLWARAFFSFPSGSQEGTALQRLERLAPLLEWGAWRTMADPRMMRHARSRARPRRRASLRRRLAPFFGKAKRCDCECLSSGATHRLYIIHIHIFYFIHIFRDFCERTEREWQGENLVVIDCLCEERFAWCTRVDTLVLMS